jgi:nitrate reductase alpha subunit
VVAAPLLHDSPDELAQPLGEVRDWRAGECEPVPGETMPKLIEVERDYGAVAEKMTSLGPLVEKLGTPWKGLSWIPGEEVEALRRRNGEAEAGCGAGRPALERADQVCEAILALSGTSNGRIAVESLRVLERRSGVPLTDLAEEHADERISFRDVGIQPRKTLTSAEWSGIETRERRYSPFTMNVDREIPWRTLTGRQQLYQDHEWLLASGEGLPLYKPPLPAPNREPGEASVAVRYLTPHSKWSVHSTYQDNLHMLTLFRGGPVVWMSREDAERIGVADNDWIEMTNPHGAVAARAVVSHRIPTGTALMYHAQDRHVNVPLSETTGTRGGTHNSVTRIQMKPSHMIGGYAHLSYGFNYYGPTGSQRDEVTLIRRRRGEVKY